MSSFSDVLDAANGLSIDEQEKLLEILCRRLAERKRGQLVCDIAEGRAEFAHGGIRPIPTSKIMNEAGGKA